MGQTKIEPLSVEKFGENLAAFAINRDDLKMLLTTVPDSEKSRLTTIEYELQILKILSVGWGIAFYMKEGEKNSQLQQYFGKTFKRSQEISQILQEHLQVNQLTTSIS